MRALILVAGAALAVAACSSNEAANNTVEDANLAMEADMNATMDMNAADANMTMDANATADANAVDANATAETNAM